MTKSFKDMRTIHNKKIISYYFYIELSDELDIMDFMNAHDILDMIELDGEILIGLDDRFDDYE